MRDAGLVPAFRYLAPACLTEEGIRKIIVKKPLLCGCLVDVATEEIPQFLHHPGVDLLEWRLDLFLRKHSLESTRDALRFLSISPGPSSGPSSPRHPVLATNRPLREGGAFEGTEEARFDMLRKAAEAGAEWVDIEDDTPEDTAKWFSSRHTRVLLSHHEFSETPDSVSLRRLAERMAGKGADTVKIVTYARSPEDNLRVLDLIPFARRELGIEMIAFCMGPLGRWSRFVCLMLGSPWTYVQFQELSAAAPGQLTVPEMRTLLSIGFEL